MDILHTCALVLSIVPIDICPFISTYCPFMSTYCQFTHDLQSYQHQKKKVDEKIIIFLLIIISNIFNLFNI